MLLMRSESSTLRVYCFEQIISPLFEGKLKWHPVISKWVAQYTQIVKLQYKNHVLDFHGKHNNGVWKISRGERTEKHQRWPNEANKNMGCEY